MKIIARIFWVQVAWFNYPFALAHGCDVGLIEYLRGVWNGV